MADIFLSYSREDEARAGSLVVEFEGRGWSVFWDRRIAAGQTWRSHIGAELESARCIVVAWSASSTESQWVAEEADEGKTRGLLIPVLFDRVQPPRGFREIQAADLSEWQPGQASARLDELLLDIERLLGKRERKVSPPARPPDSSRPRGGRVVGIALGSLGVLAAILYFGWSPPAGKNRPALAASAAAEATTVDARGPWLIVAGSYARTARQQAEQRRDALSRAGVDATVVDSNRYALLAPELWVTVAGPFASKEAADAALPKVRAAAPDAYVKRGR